MNPKLKIDVWNFVIPTKLLNPPSTLHVLLGLQSLSVNSTRSLLRSGLPTLAVHPLRVQANAELSAAQAEMMDR